MVDNLRTWLVAAVGSPPLLMEMGDELNFNRPHGESEQPSAGGG